MTDQARGSVRCGRCDGVLVFERVKDQKSDTFIDAYRCPRCDTFFFALEMQKGRYIRLGEIPRIKSRE